MNHIQNRWISVPNWVLNDSPITFESELIQFSCPHCHLNGKKKLVFRGLELLWGAISAGLVPPPNNTYTSATIRPYAQRSADLIEWRAQSSLNFIESLPAKNGSTLQLFRKQSHKDLETTEVSQISYAIGSMMCRAFTARYLDLPYSVHTSWLRNQINFKSDIRRRPDYICFDSSQNIAFAEAKGRSDSSGWSKVKTELAQKLQMSAIPPKPTGNEPIKVGCATYVSPNSGFEFYAADPEPDFDFFDFDPISIIKDYYESMRPIAFIAVEDAPRDARQSLELRLRQTSSIWQDISDESDFGVHASLFVPPEARHTYNGEIGPSEFKMLKKSIEKEYLEPFQLPNHFVNPDLTITILRNDFSSQRRDTFMSTSRDALTHREI